MVAGLLMDSSQASRKLTFLQNVMLVSIKTHVPKLKAIMTLFRERVLVNFMESQYTGVYRDYTGNDSFISVFTNSF